MSTATADAGQLITVGGYATGMTPDASKVVGMRNSYDADRYSSFIFTTLDGKLEWKTNGADYNASHLDGGAFAAITSGDIIAGYIRNPDMRLEYTGGGGFAPPMTRNLSDDELGEAIRSAAVWRGSKLYVLGTGPYPLETFNDVDDGSVATGISADGNIVCGNIWANWMPIEAATWIYDAAADEYKFSKLDAPSDALLTQLYASATDGFPVAGVISLPDPMGGGMMKPIVWRSASEYAVVDIPTGNTYYNSQATAVSPGGQWVGITGSGVIPYAGVIDTTTGVLSPITLPADITDVSIWAITDDGNIILTIQDNSYNASLYYYDAASGAIVSFTDYLNDTLPEQDFTGQLSSAQIVSVSGDGKHILLRPERYSNEAWLLELDNPQLVAAPAPQRVDLYHSSLSTVEVAFDGIDNIPDGCTLTGYKVYVDGAEVKTIDATTTGGKFYAQAPAEPGKNHYAYVTTLYTKRGEDAVSGHSATASTYVSADSSLLGVCDFENSTMDENTNITWQGDTWISSMNYGSPSEVINWHFAANDFENRSVIVSTMTIATQPWSSVFTSHFMDATDADKFYLDFRYLMRPVNTMLQDFSTDRLDVEATTDGREWTTLASVSASDLTSGQWYNLHLDLGDKYAGKVFRLRINAHGEGKAQVNWNIDDIVIGDALTGEAPAGLIWQQDDNTLRLMWHNAFGMHDVSYLDNSNILWDYNVGNLGEPLIGAIELTSDMLKPYVGQYISAVSTFLFDDVTIPQDEPTKAEAIVYADGKEVARGQLDGPFFTVEQALAHLDNPVLITEGVTYRVGVRISDYAYQQAPMYYQASEATIAGLTDLYSEDEGRTWKNASDDVVSDQNPNGYCIWPIRAHITPASDSDVQPMDEAPVYFNVFRNGVQINPGAIYEPHPWFVDPSPLTSASYTLQAYYKNGVISPMSEPVTIDFTSVRQVTFTLGISVGHGTITINGDCDGARLIDMSGKVIASTSGNSLSGIAPGIYILQAAKPDGSIETYRIVVK